MPPLIATKLMTPRFGILLAIVGVAAACSSSSSPVLSGTPTTSDGSTTTSRPAPSTTIPAGAVPAVASPGCSLVASSPVGQTRIEQTAGGETGFSFLHIPPVAASSPATPLPLVVDLHGYGEPAEVHLKLSGLAAFGDAKGFVTVAPQGPGPVPLWNVTLGSADLAFLGGVIDDVEQKVCIDRNRVFVAGLSNGAFMASAMACQFADRIGAVAPVAGLQDIPGCKSALPVPVIAFHGTADGFVAYEGGLGPQVAKLPTPDGKGTLGGGSTLPRAKGPSIPEQAAAWARRNGCGATPVEEAVASDVTLLRFPCPAGAEVELYRVTGGGHAWPGSEVSRQIVSVIGPTTFSISANELLWAFFQAHPLRPVR